MLQFKALAFGAVASVHGWERFAVSIQRILVTRLHSRQPSLTRRAALFDVQAVRFWDAWSRYVDDTFRARSENEVRGSQACAVHQRTRQNAVRPRGV